MVRETYVLGRGADELVLIGMPFDGVGNAVNSSMSSTLLLLETRLTLRLTVTCSASSPEPRPPKSRRLSV